MNKKEFLLRVNKGVLRGAQSKLSTMLGVTLPTVSGWLNGSFMPSQQNIIRIAEYISASPEEVRNTFKEIRREKINEEFSSSLEAVPLTPNNTVQLPILADVPAGLPEYSNRDVEIFKDIPRDMFPGADFVIRCIGDSLAPKFNVGDFCVIRKETEPLHGKPMLVETETGYCMKVIKKTEKGVQLCSINKKYKAFYPKTLRIVGLIIGLWSRTDRENLLNLI